MMDGYGRLPGQIAYGELPEQIAAAEAIDAYLAAQATFRATGEPAAAKAMFDAKQQMELAICASSIAWEKQDAKNHAIERNAPRRAAREAEAARQLSLF